MAQGVREAHATTGRDSPAWAAAQCDLGNVLLNSHQLDRALACYRAAAGAPAFVEPEARKDQLTYGDLLDRFDVTIADGDFNLEVQLCREPTPEELEHLNRVMQSAFAGFRHRLTRAR